jgi:hypothetical protein
MNMIILLIINDVNHIFLKAMSIKKLKRKIIKDGKNKLYYISKN